jgi:hypothetical protein
MNDDSQNSPKKNRRHTYIHIIPARGNGSGCGLGEGKLGLEGGERLGVGTRGIDLIVCVCVCVCVCVLKD